MSEMTKESAEQFFAVIFRGAHHIPSEIKPWGRGWRISAPSHRLATWDFSDLTRLVFLAHDWCVRVEIAQSGPRRVGIIIHQRDTRLGDMCERHPTIETALTDWRVGHPASEIRHALNVPLARVSPER